MIERDRILLLKIIYEGEYLVDKVKDQGLEDYVSNRDLQHIVTMALINIGSYVKSISEELKKEHNEIEWRDIAGVRDVAAHNYDGLRMEDIWDNATVDVPLLLEQVKEILRDEGEEE